MHPPLAIIGPWSLGLVFLAVFTLAPITWRIFKYVTGKITLPFELRLLKWLQDRAVCRSIGVDMEYLRARRWADTGEK